SIIAEQRRLRVEELAIVHVLDGRGALRAGDGADAGVSARVERDTLETARALEALPAIRELRLMAACPTSSSRPSHRSPTGRPTRNGPSERHTCRPSTCDAWCVPGRH